MRSKLLAFFLLATAALAQTPSHTATLTWPAPHDASASTTYNVYYVAASCPANGSTTGPTWIKANTAPISALTFVQTIPAGNYCWYVTQVANGMESLPSNTAGGTAKPGSVTFSVTIN
jgi:hypothetical protein